MKKILALVIAVMVLAASMSIAFAADHTVSVAAGTATSHVYQVYQIFRGNYDSTSGQLRDLVYGKNAATGTEGEALSQTDITNLETISGTTYADDQAKIDALEGFVNLNTTPIATLTTASGEGNVSSKSLPEGYYIIRDTPDVLSHPETYTLYLFSVLSSDVTIAPKADKPESEKHVDDQNDSDATDHSELKDSADYDIGDDVPYTLTAKLPADFANYEHYYLKFSDDMSKGLTYNGDAKIYFGASDTTGTAITLEQTTSTMYTDGKLYTYTIADLKAATYASYNLTAGSIITIKYTAKLNNNAVIGSAGNPNTYRIIYSNNPNDTGDGKWGTTPDDTNIVFTFKTIFNKVDQDQKPLTGADFELYKKVVDSSATDGYVWTLVTALGTDNHPVKGANGNLPVADDPATTETDESVAGTATQFTFTGLDAGDYKLVETVTPAGYNTIDPIEFTITATHDLESDNPQLTALTGADGHEFTMTPNLTDGSLTAPITNQSGVILPSTGGIGTTLFYVGGGLLALAAVILLVTKRRMNGND